MPRSSRSGGSRPAPSGSRGAHTMSRPALHNTAPPPAAHHPQTPAMAQPQQPGMFAQMASTAAGVAVGSSVGHGISSMLFGGKSEQPAEAAPQQPQAYDQNQGFAQQQQGVGASCENQSRDFIKCLESTNDMNSCSYYLEQLKACQAAARPY